MKINNKEFDKGLDDYIKRFDKAMIKKAKLGVLNEVMDLLNTTYLEKWQIREELNKLKKEIED